MSAGSRHCEFAEDGPETHDVSAGWTHGSAPTADGEHRRKLPDVFCHFNAP